MPMLAPQDVRASLLNMAIIKATSELGAPIDRIKIVGDASRVDCWAGARRVSIAFHRSESGEIIDGKFVPYVGSVSWKALVVPRPKFWQSKRAWMLLGLVAGFVLTLI